MKKILIDVYLDLEKPNVDYNITSKRFNKDISLLLKDDLAFVKPVNKLRNTDNLSFYKIT